MPAPATGLTRSRPHLRWLPAAVHGTMRA